MNPKKQTGLSAPPCYAGNRFEVHVEQPIQSAGHLIGWQKVGDLEVVEESPFGKGILWRGKLVLPQGMSTERRLVVRELETWILPKNELEKPKHERTIPEEREIFCNVLEF